ETPAEIKELFDGVAYQKGAAMLRMVESYLGEPVFQAGVNAYLSRHAGGNATAEDLWSELARGSSRPVDRVLGGFVRRAAAGAASELHPGRLLPLGARQRRRPRLLPLVLPAGNATQDRGGGESPSP